MATWRENSNRIRREGHRSLVWLNGHIRWWGGVIVRALQAAIAPETALTAASIGYFTLFSLFPLMLLMVAIASVWVDPLWAESEIVTQLEFVAPALGDLLGANMERVVMNRGPISWFAAAILLWSGSNIFNMLTRAMDRIWEVEKSRSPWRHRGLALLIALSVSFILMVAFFAEGAVLTIFNSLWPNELEPLRPLTTQLWAALISVALFDLLYVLLPHISITWRDVLPGAVISGVIWEVAKHGFLTIIGTYLSRSNLVYGSVTTIIVFLTWTYVSSIIFLFGSYINVEYVRRKEEEAEDIEL